jgi:hypothetical protein
MFINCYPFGVKVIILHILPLLHITTARLIIQPNRWLDFCRNIPTRKIPYWFSEAKRWKKEIEKEGTGRKR